METLYHATLAVHVGTGLVALGLFWAAIAQVKGSARHRRLGRAYASWMVVMLATAAGLAAATMRWPLAIHPANAGLDAAAVAAYAEDVRQFSAMLGEGALITFAALFFGYRAVRGPRACGERAPAVDLGFALAYLGGGIGGVVVFADGEGLIVVGGLMLAAIAAKPTALGRLRDHLIGILVSGTAAHTAFVVSVVPRMFPGIYERDPSVQAAPWVIPPLLGLLGILYALHRYGRGPRSQRGPRRPLAPPRLHQA